MIEAILQALLKAISVFCAVGACAGTVAFIVLCDYLMHKEEKKKMKARANWREPRDGDAPILYHKKSGGLNGCIQKM